jgi:Holliday junction DNA helicase RuvB
LPQFTIIGATTRIGLLSAPLRDRFGVVHRLNFYSPRELSVIVKNAAKKLQVIIDEVSVSEIARRGRGTPRVTLKFLKRVRDYAQVKGTGEITELVTKEALEMLSIDPLGLDDLDHKYLQAIIQKHNGGPVGVETIASTISEDIGTLEEVVEPYLLQIGFLQRTPRGRVATKSAYEHLGVPVKRELDGDQQKLL